MMSKPFSHHLLIASGLLFAGFAACQFSYAAYGQRIAKDGTLTEKFFLIPISVLLLAGSTVSLGGAAAARLIENGKR